jgi:hypothetical protein
MTRSEEFAPGHVGTHLGTTPDKERHRLQVVGLHDSWADMQDSDPPMMAVLAQAMGQGDFEDWLESLGQSIRGQEVVVRRLRPDPGTN